MPKNFNSILMRTVAVLLMLVFLSTAMVTGRYARYISSASGEDSARVAKFDVTVIEGSQTQSVTIPIQPGDYVDKYYEVTNNSEVTVALNYTVTNKYSNLPLSILTNLSGEIGPGETKEIPLNVTWPAEENDDKYIGMVDLLEITVQVVQVD